MTEIAEMLACLRRIEARLARIEVLLAKPLLSKGAVEWADPRDFDANTLARLEAEDEPPDPKNAHVQGAELA
jgi:hypothetical protein